MPKNHLAPSPAATGGSTWLPSDFWALFAPIRRRQTKNSTVGGRINILIELL